MDKDAAKCDICRRPVVWPSHYGDWECPHCHQRYEYDEGLKITLTDAQWALLRNPPRWIPVSERLPEGSCRVLAWDGTRVSEVHFHPRAKQSEQWYSFAGHESPTHWMPLPEPPEVK